MDRAEWFKRTESDLLCIASFVLPFLVIVFLHWSVYKTAKSHLGSSNVNALGGALGVQMGTPWKFKWEALQVPKASSKRWQRE